MDKILVLNSDYSPLNITNLKRGFKLVFKGKAEVIEEYPKSIKSSLKKYKRPSVIRLLNFVYLPYKKVPLSRYNVYRRDRWICQYDNCQNRKNLTLDHVLPKSRGGSNSWKNLVACCSDCNVKKGNKTPKEAGMVLKQEPFRPTFLMFINKFSGKVDDNWKPYMFVDI